VVLVDGALAAYVWRGGRQVGVWLPDGEPERGRVARSLASALGMLAARGLAQRRGGMLLEEINGAPATESPLALYLAEAGFTASSLGFHLRRSALGPYEPPFTGD
jgi:ATP-dependent Lhr-like helicase